jgi:hypothetical protein
MPQAGHLGAGISAPIVHDDEIAQGIQASLERAGTLRNAFSCPSDLSIFTAHNYPEPSLLERNLAFLGVSNVHVINRPVTTWSNSLRVRWFVDYLENDCRTPYVLYCDANDVILQDSPQAALDRFHEARCGVYFCSTKWSHGYSCIPDVRNWAERVHPGRYLNCGVFMGRADAAIEVFRRVLDYVTDDDTRDNADSQAFYRDELKYAEGFPRGTGCDQAILRYLEPQLYPGVQIDAESRMVWRN